MILLKCHIEQINKITPNTNQQHKKSKGKQKERKITRITLT